MFRMLLPKVAPDRFSAGVGVIAGRVVELDMLFMRHACGTPVLYIENRGTESSTDPARVFVVSYTDPRITHGTLERFCILLRVPAVIPSTAR